MSRRPNLHEEVNEIRSLINKLIGPAGYSAPQLDELETYIKQVCTEALNTFWGNSKPK